MEKLRSRVSLLTVSDKYGRIEEEEAKGGKSSHTPERTLH